MDQLGHRTTSAFDGDSCYGPVGAECQSVRRWYNLDKYLRPVLDAVSASHECNFYNASLPSIEDWTEIAHAAAGATLASIDWQWASNPMLLPTTSPYYLQPLVRWAAPEAPYFSFGSGQGLDVGTWDWPTSRRRFRCIGKRQDADAKAYGTHRPAG